jgi:AcrR family transcriptional regulator
MTIKNPNGREAPLKQTHEVLLKTRGRPRVVHLEKKILAETFKLMGEMDYRAVTIDQISARARVSKSTIYRRWPTKEELLTSAVKQMPKLGLPKSGSLVDRFSTILCQFVQRVHNTPLGAALPALMAERMRNPDLGPNMDLMLDRRREPFLKVMEWAKSNDILPQDYDELFAVDMICSPVIQILIAEGRSLGKDEVRRIVTCGFKGTLDESYIGKIDLPAVPSKSKKNQGRKLTQNAKRS